MFTTLPLTLCGIGLIILATAWSSCVVGQEPPFRSNPSPPPPAAWEKKINGAYENRGVAKIEKVATRYLLTICCDGIHSVYVQNSETLNLDTYLGKFVRVRYTHVNVTNFDVQCIKAPCEPVIERRVVLHDIQEVPATEGELSQYTTTCEN